MNIIKGSAEMQQFSRNERRRGKTIGFVPTMGALHQGHLSLISLAKTRANLVVLSIFVNPLQFGKNEDFSKYPRPIEKDTALAENAGVDVLFLPEASDFYAESHQTFVSVEGLTERFEGAIRPGHFRGVSTVVMKLFGTVMPEVAVFGKKDAQQFAVIKRMTEDLNLDIEILGGEIVREPNGLAMSSRNMYLTEESRQQAGVISKAIFNAKHSIDSGERDMEKLLLAVESELKTFSKLTIDYLDIVRLNDFQTPEKLEKGVEYVLLVTVRVEGVRLLDNLFFTA
ncbi:MAG: pantoate--beta-alanine ligase [Chloroherpetonaceae bacterium]|nr:pantoate--beta-alanine ligase [Chloroherpetonaceae bacterium]